MTGKCTERRASRSDSWVRRSSQFAWEANLCTMQIFWQPRSWQWTLSLAQLFLSRNFDRLPNGSIIHRYNRIEFCGVRLCFQDRSGCRHYRSQSKLDERLRRRILDSQMPNWNRSSALREVICGNWDLGERGKHVLRKHPDLGKVVINDNSCELLVWWRGKCWNSHEKPCENKCQDWSGCPNRQN